MSQACLPSYKCSSLISYAMWRDSKYMVRRHCFRRGKKKPSFLICWILVLERKKNCHADFNSLFITQNLWDIDNIDIVASQDDFLSGLAYRDLTYMCNNKIKRYIYFGIILSEHFGVVRSDSFRDRCSI